MLNNMKIGLRLTLGFGLVLVITTSMILLTIYNMSKVKDDFERIVKILNVRTYLAISMADRSREITVILHKLLLEKSPEQKKEIMKKLQVERETMNETFKKIEGMILSSDTEGLALVEKIKTMTATVRPLNVKVLELAMNHQTEAAIALLNREAGPAAEKWLAIINELVEHQKKRTEFRYSEAMKKYNMTIMVLFIATGLVFAVATFIALYLTRGITRPLDKAVSVSEALSTGNLNKDIETRGRDEISQLLSAMKDMVGKLRGVVSDVKIATDNVSLRSGKLSSTSDDLSKGSQELSSQVEQIVTAMTEVSQTIMDMAKNASQAADASKQASETASQGKKIVDDTVNDMVRIAQIVQEAAGTIEELGRSSAQIGEIVTVINGIADQTNLLALNAAIEAARAGEQGRGFAVVADEVRKLAERTSQATQDITQRIASIQSAAGESVDAMKRGSDEVDKGVGQAKQASTALDTIVTAASNAMDMVQRIAAATEEQSAATEQVTQNMENISSITKRAAGSSEEIKGSASELAELAKGLREKIAFFKGTAAEAEDLVKRAVDYIREHGKEKALSEFCNGSGEFVNRDLYIVVYDMNGKCLAHGRDKEKVGMDMMGLMDPDNKPIVRDRIEIAKAKGRGWQEYKSLNPATKQIENKISYNEKFEELIIGSGAYK
jgi:methyl-accepting chemotaxis protein